MPAEFLTAIKDVRDIKYPDIVLKYNEIQGWHTTISLINFDQVALDAQQVGVDAAQVAQDKIAAAASALQALTKSDEIKGIGTSAQTLTPGSTATATYNSATGVLTFGIPSGLRGEKGDPFKPSAQGFAADRSLYDAQLRGFSFLATDTSLLYFKDSDASADWSVGTAFGKGDKGDAGESVNMRLDTGNLIQWQHSSDGAVWYDLVNLDSVYSSTFVKIADVLDSVTNTETNKPASAAAVKKAYDVTPIGGIIMYDGLVANIPANWALCDGTNGTPNLVDRFIYGANSDVTIGTIGGSADAVVVAHTHTANHSHTASSNTTGSHTHLSGLDNANAGETGFTGGVTGNSVNGLSNVTSSSGNHAHTITVNTASVTTSTVGESGVGKNIPPYVKLAYIKRIA